MLFCSGVFVDYILQYLVSIEHIEPIHYDEGVIETFKKWHELQKYQKHKETLQALLSLQLMMER